MANSFNNDLLRWDVSSVTSMEVSELHTNVHIICLFGVCHYLVLKRARICYVFS